MPKKYKSYKNESLGWKRSKKLLQELRSYNALIEKPSGKRVKNIDLQRELPFYDELSIVKTEKST